jgi:hypothetical protein
MAQSGRVFVSRMHHHNTDCGEISQGERLTLDNLEIRQNTPLKLKQNPQMPQTSQYFTPTSANAMNWSNASEFRLA